MKMLLVLSLSFLLCNAFPAFHQSYVSKFAVSESAPLSAATCEPYLCSASALPQGQCNYYKSGVNQLQVCPAGSFCPWALSTYSNTTCVQGSTTIGYGGVPGDTCSSNSDCQGKSTCNGQGICQGLKTGAFCDDQPDCDVGYACHNVQMAATCQPLNSLGQACGDALTMNLCQNTLACNYNKCVSLFSKINGALVDYNVAGLVCASGFFERTGEKGGAVCAAAPLSPRLNLPISCTAGSSCRSRDGRYSTPCQCGFNGNGQGYCPLFPGDDMYQQYLTALKTYMTDSGLNNCHYLDIGMPTCTGVSQVEYDALNALHEQVLFFVAKMGNDKCVKNIITSEYWF